MWPSKLAKPECCAIKGAEGLKGLVTCAGFTGGLQENSNIDGLELSKEEKLEMLTGLDGDIYPIKGVARPLLIWLNEFVLNRLDQSYVQYDVKVRPARSRVSAEDHLLVMRALCSNLWQWVIPHDTRFLSACHLTCWWAQKWLHACTSMSTAAKYPAQNRLHFCTHVWKL